MSNQTFLYTTATQQKPLYGACPKKGQLLMAAMSIPVFWYMLYDKGSLTLGPGDDEDATPYLHMTTPTAEGIARAESRWPAVSRILGRTVGPLFQAWVSFIQAKANAYIHCETAEWFWMFDSHDKFEQELHTCLAAFDHIPARSRSGVKLNRWWGQLLGQAHVGTHDGRLRPLGNLSYCGFAYHYKVPWDDGNDAGCGLLQAKDPLGAMVGNAPGDIRQYLVADLARFGGLIDEFRLAKCVCGSVVFRLLFDPKQELAQRICAGCGAEHYICDDGEYWHAATPVAWKCNGCGSQQANIGVGFSLDDEEKSILSLSIGQRCVQCGLMGRCIGWWAYESPLDLLDGV